MATILSLAVPEHCLGTAVGGASSYSLPWSLVSRATDLHSAGPGGGEASGPAGWRSGALAAADSSERGGKCLCLSLVILYSMSQEKWYQMSEGQSCQDSPRPQLIMMRINSVG